VIPQVHVAGADVAGPGEGFLELTGFIGLALAGVGGGVAQVIDLGGIDEGVQNRDNPLGRLRSACSLGVVILGVALGVAGVAAGVVIVALQTVQCRSK